MNNNISIDLRELLNEKNKNFNKDRKSRNI